jgi:hypothetical protein
MGITVDASGMSFDNIVNAIAVVQGKLGIAGATALEAGTTIEGSVNSMKAAWSNLVTGIADDNADFGKLIDNFVTTIVGDGTDKNAGVFGNLLPRIEEALYGVDALIYRLFPIVMQRIPAIINDFLPNLVETATMIVQSFVDGISQNQEMLMKTAFETIKFLATSLISMLPQIVKLGLDLIVSLANGIATSLPTLIPTIIDVVLQIVDTLTNPETLSNLLTAALDIVLALVEGLLNPETMSKLFDGIFSLVDNLIEFLLDEENLSKIITSAIQLVIAIGQGLFRARFELMKAAVKLVASLVEAIFTTDWVKIGKDVVAGFKSGISNAWTNLKKWFKDLFGDLIGIAKKILGIASPSKVFKKLGSFTAEGFGAGFEDAFGDVERDIENALDFNGTTFGMNAYGSYSGGGALSGIGGTSFGTVNINIDGANVQDDAALADMVAERLQRMTERRGAVFA